MWWLNFVFASIKKSQGQRIPWTCNYEGFLNSVSLIEFVKRDLYWDIWYQRRSSMSRTKRESIGNNFEKNMYGSGFDITILVKSFSCSVNHWNSFERLTKVHCNLFLSACIFYLNYMENDTILHIHLHTRYIHTYPTRMHRSETL